MSKEVESLVLAAVLPDLTARMEKARLKLLSVENFDTPALRELWRMVEDYYDENRAIIPEVILRDRCLQRGIEPTKVVQYVELHRQLSGLTVLEHEFDSAIQLLKGDEMTRKVAEALVTGREILQGEYYDETSGKSPSGYEATLEYLNNAISHIEVQGSESAPEGNMADDVEKIWEAYLKREAEPDTAGAIKYGIPDIDDFTGGARNGELILIAGFTGSGKSHLITSTAWNALLAGKNVLLFTTETTREEMEIRILARHSRLDIFRKPGGIDSHKIMTGKLDDSEREVFRAVLSDFQSRDTGRIDVVQMPADGSANYVHVKADQYNRNAPVDLILIDSINLLRASRRYDSKREMLEDLLQDFKRFASSFDNGRGVPIISPWQMSRTAWEKAKEAGGVYTKASLADTSEAEKCQPYSAEVLTPNGYITMGEISKGDEIIGSDSKTQRVLEVHENGIRKIYNVLLNDGTVVQCTPGHLWRYRTENGSYVDATAEQMMEWGGEYELPELSKAPDLSKDSLSSNLPHPFLLGRMLASAEEVPGVITFSTQHPEWVANTMSVPADYAVRHADGLGEVTFSYTEDGNILEYAGMAIIVAAGLLSGSRDNFNVPSIYLNAKAVYREALLRGLLDQPTGPLDRDRVRSCADVLTDLPVKWLADSLGIFDEPRKIVRISDTETEEETRCITVSNKDRLYVTDDFVLTHNSASQIITIFVDEDNENHLFLQVLKNRSGKEMSRRAYPYDYSTSYIDGSGSDAVTSSKPADSKGHFARRLNDLSAF